MKQKSDLKNSKTLLLLFISIVLCQLAGLIGAIFTFSAIPTWYSTLAKPSFSPPNFIFGPVWTILYTLMGISLFLIWRKGLRKTKVRKAVKIFMIHLFFNAIWSIIFFGFRNPGVAFVEIVMLWFLIVLTIKRFWKIDKLAAYLLLPYLLWVSFASFLNFTVWKLNT